MFATILKEITGYFDRRTLLSTFMPTLVFVTAAVVLALVTGQGLAATQAAWQRRTGLEQAFLIAGYLTLVALWSLVVTNLRPALDRLAQGEWPAFLGPIDRRARDRHRRRRASLGAADDELEEVESLLRQAVDAMPEPGDQGGTPPEEWAGPQVDADLAALERALAEIPAIPTARSAAALLELADTLRAVAAVLSGAAAELAGKQEWDARLERFTRIAWQAGTALSWALQVVRDRRARLHQELFLQYPAEPVDVLPTRLGNILMAAEQHPRSRYHLDPVVIWSRLQPLLPDAFADLLKDAKASMDLMLTLAAYLVLLGVPAAGLAAWQGPTAASVPARLALFVALGAAATALAWAASTTARQAGLVYAEQLRAAFDLHRRLVLTTIGLSPPPDLAAERRLWSELCLFLYRGDTPDPEAFRTGGKPGDQPEARPGAGPGA